MSEIISKVSDKSDCPSHFPMALSPQVTTVPSTRVCILMKGGATPLRCDSLRKKKMAGGVTHSLAHSSAVCTDLGRRNDLLLAKNSALRLQSLSTIALGGEAQRAAFPGSDAKAAGKVYTDESDPRDEWLTNNTDVMSAYPGY